MTNPNNNQNFNDEALRINRALKRENDSLTESNNNLNEIVSKFLDRMNELEDENDKLREAIQILTIDYADVWNDDKIWQEVDTKLKKLGV